MSNPTIDDLQRERAELEDKIRRMLAEQNESARKAKEEARWIRNNRVILKNQNGVDKYGLYPGDIITAWKDGVKTIFNIDQKNIYGKRSKHRMLAKTLEFWVTIMVEHREPITMVMSVYAVEQTVVGSYSRATVYREGREIEAVLK